MNRLLVLALLLAPGAAGAQALRCDLPARVERPRLDGPTPDQPRRVLPVAGYKLALTWSPEYCRDNARRRSARFQCGASNRFGFTLHGLWPDGPDKDWPQYCRPAQLLPPRLIRENLCATPSAQLLQHEWAKHGTCMPGYTPQRYFAQARALYERLRYPDMDALSRAPLTASALATAMARVNPGLPAHAIRVTTDRRDWLDELWLCLDTRFRYVRCRPGGGVPDHARVRIWRDRT